MMTIKDVQDGINARLDGMAKSVHEGMPMPASVAVDFYQVQATHMLALAVLALAEAVERKDGPQKIHQD